MSRDVSRPARAAGLIGVGRAGSAVAAALSRAGVPVTAVAAVSAASRRRAADLLPAAAVLPADDVARRSDLLLLAVPDDVLPALVAGLAGTRAIRPGTFVLHLSGRYGLAVLDPATRAGGRPLAVHPAMTFGATTPHGTAALPDGVTFGVTAGPAELAYATALVRLLGGRPVELPEELRPLWHAGLAHGANHLVTLVASAADVLRAAGVDDPATALRPLLTAALDGALVHGSGALTGPVARGDAGTVAAHLDALSVGAPAERDLYLYLARATAARRPDVPAALTDLLTDEDLTREPTR